MVGIHYKIMHNKFMPLPTTKKWAQSNDGKIMEQLFKTSTLLHIVDTFGPLLMGLPVALSALCII